jgi:putative serine protease PepD
MYQGSSCAARPAFLKAVAAALFIVIAAFYSSASALTVEETATIAAYEKVAPSVVNITTQMCESEFFFCAVPSVTGSGSGVVLREDGLIITNNHVVSEALNIWAVLSDGRRLAATTIASDPNDDLAVIRVDPGNKPLKAIALGDSDKLRVGERVLAVGNPFGLGQTLTAGVVSMTDRSIKNDDVALRHLIQTDASINPGNSGGALINLDGELVGLCTAILSPTGSSVRIGFALPVNRIKAVAPGLVRAWPRVMGWVLAILLVAWFLKRIYGGRDRPYY